LRPPERGDTEQKPKHTPFCMKGATIHHFIKLDPTVEVIYQRSCILLASKRVGLPIGCKTSDI